MRFNSPKIHYNQTWEDFYVDEEALEIDNRDNVAAITSAGCNILNMALKRPSRIFAADINPAQNYLLGLKIAALKNLDYPQFWQFFGQARSLKNVELYYKKLRTNLSGDERYFWDKNIGLFKRGLFKEGKLSSFRLLRSCLFKLCSRENLETFLNLQDLSEQKRFYLKNLEPKLWHPFSEYMPTPTMLVYGVHPRQIYLSIRRRRFFLKDLFKERLKGMFTLVPINRNYFWQQIILGKYKDSNSCPPYLREKNFAQLRKGVESIKVYSCSITEFLKGKEEASISKFNLSDVPEFLSKKEQITLWSEVLRVAKNEAIFIYRSFSPDFFPPRSFCDNFKYYKDQSQPLTKKEMTGSYAQVYKYKVIK